jgi:transcriptional regulator with XRE-family HTH domain
MVIAANIKLLRRLLGLSARELEDLCGLPRNIIGKMESRSAYTKINLQKLILLAAAFGVKPHVLLVADVESRVEGALLTLFETIGQETFPPRTD